MSQWERRWFEEGTEVDYENGYGQMIEDEGWYVFIPGGGWCWDEASQEGEIDGE